MILAREKLEYSSPPEMPQQIPNVKSPPQSRRRKTSCRLPVRQKLILVGVVLCCFVMSIMVAFYYAQVAYLGYKIDLLQQKMVDLRLESHNLDQEITKEASLKKIETVAIDELGMIKPSSKDVVPVAAISFPERSVAQNQNQYHIIQPEEPKKQEEPRNEIIQAFAEMVER